MAELKEMTFAENFVLQFDHAERQRDGHGAPADHPWLRELRRSALAQFEKLGLPTQRIEEWRFTSLAPLARLSFQAPEPDPRAETEAAPLVEATALETECCRAVFVNGRLARSLSRLDGLEPGIQFMNLADAVQREPALVQPYLAQHAAYDKHPFVALNTAFLNEGAFVRIGRGRVIEQPLHIIYVTTNADGESPQGTGPWHVHPRNLILVGEGAQARIIETYVGPAGAEYLSNPITEIVAGQDAIVEHLKIQSEPAGAFHVATLAARLDRGARFTATALSTGAAIARHDTTAVLDGEGIECSLNGLYLLRERQHCDFQTRMIHAQPHGTSRQLYKGILDDKSSGVFNGRIVVRPHAQKTDAIQSSRCLLLSGDTTVNTQPQLEIFADDVRCTHGAAVGALDDEAIFYLRTRGIDHAAARGLLTYAFANEVLEKISIHALRDRLEKMLVTRFKPGEIA